MKERQKGGLGPRRRGDAFEVAVCADLERVGWWCARLRQGGGQLVDVVAVGGPMSSWAVWHIQCKARAVCDGRPELRRGACDCLAGRRDSVQGADLRYIPAGLPDRRGE